MALSRDKKKLFPHFGEAGTAVFAVKKVEYGGHDRTPLFDHTHASISLEVHDVIWITVRRISRSCSVSHSTLRQLEREQQRPASANSRPILRRVVAGHALEAADSPLLAAEDRMFFPLGERRLRKETCLHGHVVLDDDFLAANWLADGAESMAHDSDDGDLHWPSSNVLERE